jgi:hypothetical protein
MFKKDPGIIDECIASHFDMGGSYNIDSLGRVSSDGFAILHHEFPQKKLPFKWFHVEGNFQIDSGNLDSLVGSPESVEGDFCATHNFLSTLEGGPKFVRNLYDVAGNDLEDLKGLPESMPGSSLGPSRFDVTYNHNLGMLRLLLVKGLGTIVIWPRLPHKTLQIILNKYLRTGPAGIMPCAAEMIKAGYAGNARL